MRAVWFSLAVVVGISVGQGARAEAAEPAAKKANRSAAAPPSLNYVLERFDQNKDGALSKQEIPEEAQQLYRSFERIDANQDGKLDRTELARAMEFARRQMEASERSVAMPADLDRIPVQKKEGQVPLPLDAGRDLGKPLAPLTPAELDELVASALIQEGVERAAPRVSEDRFVRRVFLDTIGRLPSPADIEEYLADPSPDKKSRLVDRLLEMPQYGRHWARYWVDVIGYRATTERFLFPFGAEEWLADRLNQNAGWDDIAGDIISAQGLSSENSAGFFMAAHMGEAPALAGEATRIFLGLQISCAECHDHPTDTWKRDQFHELASFFGRVAVRLRMDLGQGPRGPIVEVAARPGFRDEYRKPDLADPSQPGAVVQPVFLSGQPIPAAASDAQRRGAVATFITSKRNPYFARAFVNRIWAELLGAGFTNPVDDLGSHQEVAYPELFEALARSFAASDYDIKGLLRTILKSQAYDRQFHELNGSSEETVLFQTVAPTRLAADAIFDSIDWILGEIDPGDVGMGPRQRFGSPRFQFRQVFGFDPSTDPDEVEGSIPQALVLMNHPSLRDRIDARRPGTLLHKLLGAHENDRDVVRMLYLRVLARKPAAEETEACLAYRTEVRERAEAFEDILWALLNSTEFLNNH